MEPGRSPTTAHPEGSCVLYGGLTPRIAHTRKLPGPPCFLDEDAACICFFLIDLIQRVGCISKHQPFLNPLLTSIRGWKNKRNPFLASLAAADDHPALPDIVLPRCYIGPGRKMATTQVLDAELPGQHRIISTSV